MSNTPNKLKVLFATSEAHPLIKTGGLADVSGALPPALRALGCDVRIVMPAYRDAVKNAGKVREIAALALPEFSVPVTLLEATLPGTPVKTWLVDFPPAFDRPGNPYVNELGHPWHDNAARFTLFARIVALLALDRAELGFRPDVLHCNDWQTGLAPALLAGEALRPATLFTIHNLSYQGLFPYSTFTTLGLSPLLWSFEALEFHGELSFIKGGLVFADWLNTVSPTYAREIQTPEFGYGLEGLLRHRAENLIGILNGIDDRVWNPGKDPHLTANYSARRLRDKAYNKRALQAEFGLEQAEDVPVVAMIGRLVHQKGIDLVLEALPRLMEERMQLLVLGTGEAQYEDALRAQAKRHPGRIAVRIGFDEAGAHRIEAGADMFLMPSRFEPCGLNQLYSLRYGTLPIVRRVGGLADTVVDAAPDNLQAGTATGVVFEQAGPDALIVAVTRALSLYRNARAWKRLLLTGMRQDFSWRRSAADYLELYRRAIAERRG